MIDLRTATTAAKARKTIGVHTSLMIFSDQPPKDKSRKATSNRAPQAKFSNTKSTSDSSNLPKENFQDLHSAKESKKMSLSGLFSINGWRIQS